MTTPTPSPKGPLSLDDYKKLLRKLSQPPARELSGIAQPHSPPKNENSAEPKTAKNTLRRTLKKRSTP